MPKISCKPEQKAAGKLKGIQRAKASLNKPSQGDFELAMALSAVYLKNVRKKEKQKKTEKVKTLLMP